MTINDHPDQVLDRISRVNALLAAQAGGEAFRAGERPSACPYGLETVTTRFLGHYWLAGWWKAASPDGWLT